MMLNFNRSMKTLTRNAGLAFGIALSLTACGGSNNTSNNSTSGLPTFADSIFLDSGRITNPFFPLIPGEYRSYIKTDEGDPVAVIEQRVLEADPDNTLAIAGIEGYLIVEENEFEEGKVVETSRDYYAQDSDGHVWQLGSDVVAYDEEFDPEGGDNSDSWTAGVNGAVAGLVMPAVPRVGDSFAVPGEPDNLFTIVALDQSVTVPYDGGTNQFDADGGTGFSNVVTIEQSNGALVEDTLHYADSVGLVFGSESTEETLALFSFAEAEYSDGFNAQNFSNPRPNTLDELHSYRPLFPGNKWVYLKNIDGGVERITTEVSTTKTKTIMGIQCIVVDDKVEQKLEGSDDFTNEEITEDYFAMDDTGNLWYMGEESSHFDPETGEFVRDGGSWIAGETMDENGNVAQPGILLPASPEPGMLYRQEYLANIAEDIATTIGDDLEVELEDTIDGVDYSIKETGVLRTHEYAGHELNVTEPLITEFKYYIEGVGKIAEQSPADEELGLLIEFVDASAL